MKIKFLNSGFTLVELMVTISIIGILAGIVYANFADSKAVSRDQIRKTTLKDLQLAINLYKAQNGYYPASGCTASGTANWAGPGPSSVNSVIPNCDNYIQNLVPDFIAALPVDPSDQVNNKGYIYRSNGSSYKLLSWNAVEKLTISDVTDDFARCTSLAGACASSLPANTYAVFSPGVAETW
jgi:prepilin-type N-terminal cleavage/methylation domain-containing protein